MSNAKERNPIYDPTKLVAEDGEILTPIYKIGNPLNYRLDMGKGVLNFEGLMNLTKPGQPFNVLPIAFRCLKDSIFAQPEKRWCEVYFINEKKQLGMFMFHGFSVQNLSEATRVLQYDGGRLSESIWTISLVEKKNKDNQKFYIAEFAFQELEEEKLTIWRGVQQNVLDEFYHIYRADTADSPTMFQENWSDGKTPSEKELQDESERLKALEAAFESKVEKAQEAKTKSIIPKKVVKPAA